MVPCVRINPLEYAWSPFLPGPAAPARRPGPAPPLGPAQAEGGREGGAPGGQPSAPILRPFNPPLLFLFQSRKGADLDREKKAAECKVDSIGSGRAIPIKQVSTPSLPSSFCTPRGAAAQETLEEGSFPRLRDRGCGVRGGHPSCQARDSANKDGPLGKVAHGFRQPGPAQAQHRVPGLCLYLLAATGGQQRAAGRPQ